MSAATYTIWADFDDPLTCHRFAEWLNSEHIGRVLDAGADQADLIQHPPSDAAPGGTLEVRYLFGSHATLDTYLEKHSPALRAETIERFGSTPSIRYRRVVATLIGRHSRQAR